MKQIATQLGTTFLAAIAELGYVFVLLLESLRWIFFGKLRHQPVRIAHVFQEAMQIGVKAVPIVAILCMAVGMMLAIQGIETLKPYGAQGQVIMGIAVSVTREFAALIVGIVVAGRSGSAITARIGTMMESQEIDALRAIGIDPVRYLVAPILIAMLVVVPALTILGEIAGIFGGGVYSSMELNITVLTYMERSFDAIRAWDIAQGMIKSAVFAVIIALVGVSNGFQVKGGAEGVGRATTRSVVMSVSFIVIADMIFTFFMTR
ncbi:MAG: phospholipid/cholesterol/gamma-HCH transport system permease protein [Pseudomonadota bacterium]|nr:phospholipid/cholesterol/gamma-HCH transport system permease protein [Pseudomonadota bacterium]